MSPLPIQSHEHNELVQAQAVASAAEGPARVQVATTLSSLHMDIYPVLLDYLPTQTLASLTRVCRSLHQAVIDHLGYSQIAIHNAVDTLPDQTTSDNAASKLKDLAQVLQTQTNLLEDGKRHPVNSFSSGPPPSASSQCSGAIMNKVFVPVLDAEPACFVLDTNTMQWSKYLIEIVRPSPNSEDSDYPSFFPLSTSVAASPSQSCLYMFGGLRRLPSADLGNERRGLTGTDRDPSSMPPSFEKSRSDSDPSIRSVNSYGGSSAAHGDASEGTSDASLPIYSSPSSVDYSTGMRLSSTLYRLDIPPSLFQPTGPTSADAWKLYNLGDSRRREDHKSSRTSEVKEALGETPGTLVSDLSMGLEETEYTQISAASAKVLRPSCLSQRNTDESDIRPDLALNSASGSGSSSTATIHPPTVPAASPISTYSPRISRRITTEAGHLSLWPGPRRDHTLNVVGNWIVLFGGQGPQSEGESDVWAWNLTYGGWTMGCVFQRGREDIQPPPVYRHASAVTGDSIYFYGECLDRNVTHMIKLSS
jgi:hypothetical protein